jgi:hypothetical protein
VFQTKTVKLVILKSKQPPIECKLLHFLTPSTPALTIPSIHRPHRLGLAFRLDLPTTPQTPFQLIIRLPECHHQRTRQLGTSQRSQHTHIHSTSQRIRPPPQPNHLSLLAKHDIVSRSHVRQNTKAVGLPKENLFSTKPSNWIHNYPRPDAHGENNLQFIQSNTLIQGPARQDKQRYLRFPRFLQRDDRSS